MSDVSGTGGIGRAFNPQSGDAFAAAAERAGNSPLRFDRVRGDFRPVGILGHRWTTAARTEGRTGATMTSGDGWRSPLTWTGLVEGRKAKYTAD